jgi:hypothetical protein
VYDATFIKLANLGITYVLPNHVTKWLKASRSSVFINATNLWYWYRQDAPQDRNGIRQYRFSFPEAQSITGGLKLNW